MAYDYAKVLKTTKNIYAIPPKDADTSLSTTLISSKGTLKKVISDGHAYLTPFQKKRIQFKSLFVQMQELDCLEQIKETHHTRFAFLEKKAKEYHFYPDDNHTVEKLEFTLDATYQQELNELLKENRDKELKHFSG